MIPLDGPAIGSISAAAAPATLLPMVFDPDTGRLCWLHTNRRLVASPVTADGRTSLAAAAPVPRYSDDARTNVVATLLHDIAEFTGRPLRIPVPAPPVAGREQYIVVWVDTSSPTSTPRQAAEQAWRTIRRPGSHACLFLVVNPRTGARAEIDLLDDVDPPSTQTASPA